jgi:hypothetical protein
VFFFERTGKVYTKYAILRLHYAGLLFCINIRWCVFVWERCTYTTAHAQQLREEEKDLSGQVSDMSSYPGRYLFFRILTFSRINIWEGREGVVGVARQLRAAQGLFFEPGMTDNLTFFP